MKTQLPPRAFVFQALTIVCVAALLAALWKQRADLARINKAYGQLKEQNAELQKNTTLGGAGSGRQAAATTGAPQPQDAAALQKAHAPKPEPTRLALAGAEVNPIPGGLATTLRFSQSKTGPLGLLMLVAWLPKNAGARILDLAPVGPAAYSDISQTVSEDGRYAIFQGTLGEETDVRFNLSVSGSAAPSVRGTCGIGTFVLEIQPSGAKVRGK